MSDIESKQTMSASRLEPIATRARVPRPIDSGSPLCGVPGNGFVPSCVDLEIACCEDAMIARGDHGPCLGWNGPGEQVTETGLCLLPEGIPQFAPGRCACRLDGELAEDFAHLRRGSV